MGEGGVELEGVAPRQGFGGGDMTLSSASSLLRDPAKLVNKEYVKNIEGGAGSRRCREQKQEPYEALSLRDPPLKKGSAFYD